MSTLIRSEILKMKHTFPLKLVVISPVFTILLGLVLSGTSAQPASYNWWYEILLPITLSILCASTIIREKKTHYQNVLCLSSSRNKLWLSKMIAIAILLLLSNLIMWFGCIILGTIAETKISILNSFISCILLTVTYLWQIPFIMILCKFGSYLSSILLSIGGNVIISLWGAEKSYFLINLYAIPVRIVCPFLGIHPNGLAIETGSYLLNKGIVLPALFISLMTAVLLTILSSKLLSNEVK